MSALDRGFRFLCALQAGAQLSFAAVAAQVVFSPAVAALPHDDPRRALAADQVGEMLGRLDGAALLVSALAVLLAWLLAKKHQALFARALWPLLAALCATASMLGTTPAIQALRAAGRVHEPIFGIMHGVSSGLLLLQMLVFAWAALAP